MSASDYGPHAAIFSNSDLLGNDGHETNLQKHEINIKNRNAEGFSPAGSKKLEGNIYLDLSAMELLCESHHEEDDFFQLFSIAFLSG